MLDMALDVLTRRLSAARRTSQLESSSLLDLLPPLSLVLAYNAVSSGLPAQTGFR